jgi:hypothetical protein
MEASYIRDTYMGEAAPKWADDFYKIALDGAFKMQTPRPAIYISENKRIPCLTGGLAPQGDHAEEDYEWAYFKSGKYKHVPFGSLTVPTDKEYEVHFKKIIDNRLLRIKTAFDNETSRETTTIVRNDMKPTRRPGQNPLP